jgi:transposase
MLVAGESIQLVAQRLGISAASAQRYKAMVEEGGLGELENMGVGERQSALNAQTLEWIANSLRGSPMVFGFETDHWTDGRFQLLISKQFCIC